MSVRTAGARVGRVPLAFSVSLMLVTSAAAQFPGAVQPGQFPPAGTMSHPGMGAPTAAPAGPPGQPPCYGEFMPLRSEAEKRAGLLGNGIKKKVPREDLCKLFKSFAEAEVKVIKFVSTNAQSCGIPSQAIDQMKTNHAKTTQARDQVCSGGGPGMAGAGPRPSGPGLSEALGTARSVTPNTSAGRSGAFETLTGNALTR